MYTSTDRPYKQEDKCDHNNGTRKRIAVIILSADFTSWKWQVEADTSRWETYRKNHRVRANQHENRCSPWAVLPGCPVPSLSMYTFWFLCKLNYCDHLELDECRIEYNVLWTMYTQQHELVLDLSVIIWFYNRFPLQAVRLKIRNQNYM